MDLNRYNVPDKSNWNSQRSNNSNPNPVNSRNRFSRHKNRDRFQERHTVERDRHVERGQRFSNEVTPRTRLGSEAASRGRPVSEAITRGRPGSHRFSRAQSMVKERTREPDSQPMKRTPHDPSKALDYSMTLPASYGRNKFRQIGKCEVVLAIFLFTLVMIINTLRPSCSILGSSGSP